MKLLIYEEYSTTIHGNQRYILLLCERLPSVGCHLSIVTHTQGPLAEMAGQFVPVETLSSSECGLLNRQKIAALRRVLRKHRPNILMCNNERSMLVAATAGVGFGVPIIWYIKNARVFWPTDLLCALIAKRVLTISEKLPRSKGAWFDCLTRRKCSVLPIGVPLASFTTVADVICNDGPLRLLVAAAITPMKGFDNLLDSFERLDRQGVSLEVRIIGATPAGKEAYAESLRLRAGRLKNIDVHFLGWTEDVVEHLSWTQICVLPSLSEGVPRSLIEAMAAGRPVIATDVGGVSEIVPSDVGVVVPPGSSELLAAAIRDLASRPERIMDMGRRARKWAQSHYDIESHVSRLYEIITELTTGSFS